MDRVKMELTWATTIKRDRVVDEVVNELVVFDGFGVGVGAGAGQDQGSTSCRICCGFLCEKCKNHDENSIVHLQPLS